MLNKHKHLKDISYYVTYPSFNGLDSVSSNNASYCFSFKKTNLSNSFVDEIHIDPSLFDNNDDF